MGNGGIAPPFLTSARFTTGERALDKGLCELQSRSGPCGVEKNLLPLPGVFYRMFPNKILYSFLVSKMVATWPACHSLLDFIIQRELGDVYKSQVDLYVIP
jgi:hypothetical protein